MLVRTDIPLADQICQSSHAAHESGIRFGDPDQISSIVLCGVPDERELEKAHWMVEQSGIRSYLFREPDLGDEATALATEPIFGSKRKLFSKFNLWLPNGQSLKREA